jgi:hypothetical protein
MLLHHRSLVLVGYRVKTYVGDETLYIDKKSSMKCSLISYSALLTDARYSGAGSA